MTCWCRCSITAGQLAAMKIWGTGKLYFGSMKVKHCRIHNRPAFNYEVHSTRDMGIAELSYCYEGYELTDAIFRVGANRLETQTNLHRRPSRRSAPRVTRGTPLRVDRS